ncbi:ROK family transcriptional regulator [Rhodobacteraceae bacterium ASV31]|nr:ROK family transcriptional regulator [Anianabacter salinae]
MRAYNERLVLSILRQRGPLSKSDIARITGLSAQTVSVIMRSLESDGLLLKGDPVRGKVGQPSVPMRLAEDGAFFFGLKIGRRSAELILTNFLGTVLGRVHATHRFPTPESTVTFMRAGLDQLAGQLSPADRLRISGVGIAMPFQIWDWARTINVPASAMAAWREVDIRAEIAALCDWPVYLQNDASAACGAEVVFGSDVDVREFLYFYLGYFIGGGVVLNGSLYTGVTGNAGALGTLPVPGPSGGTVQLIDVASLQQLEEAIRAADGDSEALWQSPDGWAVDPAIMNRWLDRAASGIAYAIASASSVIDFRAVLVDGWLPAQMRRDLVARIRTCLESINLAGIIPPDVREATVGPDARALGAASLPLSERFLVDPSAILKAS